MIDRTNAVQVMAATAWAEARGDGRIGMLAVANVILTRAAHPRWWGHDIISVCLDPWQFSCWNADDPNLPKIEAVTEADPEFAVAIGIAKVAAQGRTALADMTRGADSYYDVRMPTPPGWAARAVPTVTILHHRFMRVELAAPSGLPDAPPISMHSPIIAALSESNTRADAAERAAGAV